MERPLRLRVELSVSARAAFRVMCAEADEEPIADLVDRLAAHLGEGPHTDYNAFLEQVQADAEAHNVKLTAKRLKLLQANLAQRDKSATPVIKKIHKPGKAEVNPLNGRYALTPAASLTGRGEIIVEYEPDTDLRDTEQVPLLEAGGIAAFFPRKCLPYAPDAWIDEARPRWATRFRSRGTSTSRNRYARWTRFAPIFWR